VDDGCSDVDVLAFLLLVILVVFLRYVPDKRAFDLAYFGIIGLFAVDRVYGADDFGYLGRGALVLGAFPGEEASAAHFQSVNEVVHDETGFLFIVIFLGLVAAAEKHYEIQNVAAKADAGGDEHDGRLDLDEIGVEDADDGFEGEPDEESPNN